MQLLPHPADPSVPGLSLSAGLARGAAGRLAMTFRVEGNLALLRLPPVAPPARADQLWRHTCLEAFVRPAASGGYGEWNFAPSGAWAAYAFDDYRAGMRAPPLPDAPVAHWSRGPDWLALAVELDPPALLGAPARGPLRAALAAVIETQSGTISHWALHHPEPRADFHHPGGFLLELDA